MQKSLKEIKKFDKELKITWNDNSITNLSSTTIRQECPCAGCREARGDNSHQKPISNKKSVLNIIEHTKEEETTIESIWAIGNYALGIKFQDGHDSGIYTFDYLIKLSDSKN